jgi:hypothetical protein
MTREEAIQYVSFQMDDAHDRRKATPADVRCDDRLVGFHQLFETVVVAVRSHLPGIRLNDDRLAKDLARNYLDEIGWFGEGCLDANFIF